MAEKPQERGSLTPVMPPDMELVRTTPLFDPETVPKAILGSHQVATGVWGRLVCRSGRVGFAFEEPEKSTGPAEPGESGESAEPTEPEVFELAPGEHFDIPPERKHRVVLLGPATFVVEFYRPRSQH